MKVRKGSIVKLKTGQIGMVTYKRSNQEIGINCGHYKAITSTLDDGLRQHRLKGLLNGCFGVDGFYCIDDIIEVIDPNTSTQAV